MKNWIHTNRKILITFLGIVLGFAGAVVLVLDMLWINTGSLISAALMLWVVIMAGALCINLICGWPRFWLYTLVMLLVCAASAWYFPHNGVGAGLAALAGLLSGTGLAIVRRQRDDYAEQA